MSNNELTLDALKDLLENTDYSVEEVPKEAMPIGSLCRSVRLDRLGVVIDAFYGGLDEDQKKIVIYSILILPESKGMNHFSEYTNKTALKKSSFYVSNEYEYEVIGYLMIPPVDISIFSSLLGNDLLL